MTKVFRFIAILAICSSVQAADCGRYYNEDISKVVFEGMVERVEFVMENNEPVSKEVTFSVDCSLEGGVKDVVIISTGLFSDSSLGYPFLCGESYRVYAIEKESGRYYTDTCMQTTPLSSGMMSPDELEYFLYDNPDISVDERQNILKRMLCP